MAGFLDLLGKLATKVNERSEHFEEVLYHGGTKRDGVNDALWYLKECRYMWTWPAACKFQNCEWPEMRARILEIAQKAYGADAHEVVDLAEALPAKRTGP